MPEFSWMTADCNLGSACPLEMGGGRAAWDPGSGRVILVGDRSDGDCEDSQGAYCIATWSADADGDWELVAVTDFEGDGNPTARSFHVMTWDQIRSVILLHGGQQGLSTVNGDCGDGSRSVGSLCLYADVWE